jgi:hypothetical protein
MEVGELFVTLGLVPKEVEWKRGEELIGTLKKGLGVLAGYFAASKIEGFVDDVVELGGKLNDMADKTGLNVEELQELGYAAKLAGGDIDQVAAGLKHLTRNMTAASDGSGEQAKAFAKAGIAVKDADGKMRPAADVLGDIADHLQSLSKDDRPAMAMQLLGKSGAQMVPWLKDGSEGLAKMRQEARDLGVVIGGEDIEALDNLGDDMDRLKMTMGGLKNQIVIALLPALQEVATGILDWVKANREAIKNTLVSVVHGMIAAFRFLAKVIGGVIDVVSALVTVFKTIGGVFAEVLGVLMDLGAAINDVLTPAFQATWDVIKAVWDLLSEAGSIVADVVRTIVSKFGELLSRVRSALMPIVDVFRTIGRGIADVFEAIVDKAIEIGHKLRNLPIIKQAIDAGSAIKDVITGGDDEKSSNYVPLTPSASSSNAPARASDGGNSVTVGSIDIQVTPTPGMNATDVGNAAYDAFEKRFSGILRHTADATGVA